MPPPPASLSRGLWLGNGGLVAFPSAAEQDAGNGPAQESRQQGQKAVADLMKTFVQPAAGDVAETAGEHDAAQATSDLVRRPQTRFECFQQGRRRQRVRRPERQRQVAPPEQCEA